MTNAKPAAPTNPVPPSAPTAPRTIDRALLPFGLPPEASNVDTPFNPEEHWKAPLTVFAAEMAAINARRARNERLKHSPNMAGLATGEIAPVPSVSARLTGVALSGGGVRSAAFSLGALQALYAAGSQRSNDKGTDLPAIDYLSTVSGGGYIGASLSIGMSRSDGRFPFGMTSTVIGETQQTRHIRDNSRYLIQDGLTSIVSALLIWARGLVVSAIALAPPLLMLAALFALLFNDRDGLAKAVSCAADSGFVNALYCIASYWPAVALLIVALMAVAVSLCAKRILTKRRRIARAVTAIVVVLAAIGLFQLQASILHWYLTPQAAQPTPDAGFLASATWLDRLAKAVLAAAPWLAAFSTALLPFLSKLAVKAEQSLSGALSTRLAAYASRLALIVISVVLPLAVWALFIMLAGELLAPTWTKTLPWIGKSVHPAWLAAGLALVLLGFWIALSVNANSLHQVYRDRLSSAFIQNASYAEARDEPDPAKRAQMLKAIDEADQFRMSDIDPSAAPFHIVNTALAVPGSRFANQRVRNADFFSFTPLHLGSEITGYVDVRLTERSGDEKVLVKPLEEIDLGMAIAISGAAVAPNMGTFSVRLLAPTLAFLNIRLGRWVARPDIMLEPGNLRWLSGVINPKPNILQLWREARSRSGKSLDSLPDITRRIEPSDMRSQGFRASGAPFVYLSDGGHIENLGVYELLRRHCSLIICIDAGCDPRMVNASMAQAEMFSRLDLGARIDIDLRAIGKTHADGTARIDSNAPEDGSGHGPHVALGLISYAREGRGAARGERASDAETVEKGALLYVKPSLSGDENSYVRAYRQRNPTFPHETTGDQFFSEEQFEAYRALGEHVLSRALRGLDAIALPSWLSEEDREAVKDKLTSGLGLDLGHLRFIEGAGSMRGETNTGVADHKPKPIGSL